MGIKPVVEHSLPDAAPAGVLRLTRGLAARDENAFREFHQLYFDRLFQFLLVVARGEEHEAEEALQETLLRVLRYARPFDTEDAFWSWLKVVARSAARDAGRKQSRYGSLLRNFALRRRDEVPASGFDELERLRGILEECLLELDPADRELIEGKYLAETSVRELSAQTGLTDKAVESRLLRLRRELRERLLKKLRAP
jgi:RNA polymerase sigma-70 factor (ECF subfamily)